MGLVLVMGLTKLSHESIRKEFFEGPLTIVLRAGQNTPTPSLQVADRIVHLNKALRAGQNGFESVIHGKEGL